MTHPITTTLEKIRAARPCTNCWKKLSSGLGGIRKYGKDTPLRFSQIVEINDVDDALWCVKTICPEHAKEVRLLACDIAERVIPVWEKEYPNDRRPQEAIAVSRRYAEGEATNAELEAARDAAREAAWDAAWGVAWAAAEAAWDAARDAAWAATEAAAWAAAGAAARDAAGDAAGDAARDAAGDAGDAGSAGAAARDAAGDAGDAGSAGAAAEAAARDAERAAQKELIIKWLG